MLSDESSSVCGRAEALRDYAFDELPPDDRREMEYHLAACGDCGLELDRLRLTTAALRTLADREIPQRIAFVSDRVFEPSPFWRFWNSGGLAGARLGFASACVLAAALVISAWHVSSVYRPAAVRTIVQTAAGLPGQINASPDEVSAAVARAVAQVRTEDAQIIRAAIETSERKHDAEYRNQMATIGENFMVLQKRLDLGYASLASNDVGASDPRPGAGQCHSC